MGHNIFRLMLQDTDSVMKLSETLRNAYSEIISENKMKSIEVAGRNSDLAQVYEALSKTYDDIATSTWLFQALALNAIEDNRRLNVLIESLLKSVDDKDKTIVALRNHLNEQASKIAEISKHKTNLEWIDKFFSHAKSKNIE